MAELKWGGSAPLRVLGVVSVAGLYGVLPAIQHWGHPLLVAANLVFAPFLILLCLRDGRLTTAGDQLRVSGALRTQRVRAAEIAGIARSTQLPRTLMIWTLDGRFVRVSPVRKGFRKKNHVQRRLEELDAWFVEHRGPDWSLETLQAA